MAKADRETERRPDPDALLALAAKDQRGKLKVFLGAAPGVGKTYAMLLEARRLKAQGRDVLVGVVETHGRRETEALLDGLGVLPRRATEYRGRTLLEFDIDAALARRPSLLLVDELAHTNAPQSRHPKRWRDVEELLDAGIDVWTALNIQHLESLADVVAHITGVAVQETVPDTVLQNASEVVLVDLPPTELIARLHEGKIYMPDTARRAIENFFTPSNLTALRELALRRTAERVDDQMADYLKQRAIEGPWEASERVLVCLGGDLEAERLVRRTSRLATTLNASWIAAHVEVGAAEPDDARIQRIGHALKLAEELGGEVVRLSGRDLVGEILRCAKRENVTQILAGRSRAGWLRRLWGRSLSEQLIKKAHGISVQIVAIDGTPEPVRLPRSWLKRDQFLTEIAAAGLSVSVAVGIGELLTAWLQLPNLSMVFLAAVLICAVGVGTRAAVLASMLSFAAFNFFFIEPIYTFTVAQPSELFALIIFLAVAMLTGSLAGRVRDQAQLVMKRAESTQSLYDFSRKLAAASKVDDVIWAATAHAQKLFGGKIVLLLPNDGELESRMIWPPDEPLDAAELSAARWAFNKAEPAGWRTGTLPNVRFEFRPLLTSRGVVGVCGREPANPAEALTPDQERNLNAVLEQTAIALDRALLVGEAVKVAALQENENVRDALLDSLSHDLRSPLSSITGAVTTLRELGEGLAVSERQDLLRSIEVESGRLTRFVSNLLDMSRIESGAIKIKRDWVDVADVIRNAAERSRKAFPAIPIEINLAPDLPFIRGDAQLLEQVLFNLLDNAQKYGGDAGTAVYARSEASEVVISVTDEGPGVKPADLERIFEKFYRGGRTDGRKSGTGLGLSIARGLIKIMGGTITAQSPAVRRRGTRIIIRLPAAETPSEPGAAA